MLSPSAKKQSACIGATTTQSTKTLLFCSQNVIENSSVRCIARQKSAFLGQSEFPGFRSAPRANTQAQRRKVSTNVLASDAPIATENQSAKESFENHGSPIAEGPADDSDKYVEIGVVVGTHGIKGEVVIRSLTDFPKKRFGTPGTRWFRRPGRRQQPLVELELLKGRRGPSRKGKDDSILLK
jgi:hypothetical protein